MRVALGGVRARGHAIDLRRRDAVDPAVVLAAVRDPEDERVRCPAPGPVHEHVGHLREGASLDLERALAAAARSQGRRVPEDATRDTLRPVAVPPPPDPTDARRRVAEASADVEALRERTERLAGRVEERRSLDVPADVVAARYRTAARELAAAETERLAAEQALERAREGIAAAREDRRRALAVADRRRNLARAARSALVEVVSGSFERALRAVPGGVAASPDEYDGPALPAALAVARVARVRAPLVVETPRFERATRAAACLDASVLLV